MSRTSKTPNKTSISDILEVKLKLASSSHFHYSCLIAQPKIPVFIGDLLQALKQINLNVMISKLRLIFFFHFIVMYHTYSQLARRAEERSSVTLLGSEEQKWAAGQTLSEVKIMSLYPQQQTVKQQLNLNLNDSCHQRAKTKTKCASLT